MAKMTSPKQPASPLSAARRAACAMALACAAGAWAQAPSPDPKAVSTAALGVGTITHLSGTLTVRKGDGSVRFLSVKSGITEGDTLITAPSTYARMKFSDGAEMVLRPESQMKVNAYKYDEKK